ncbi:MAG: aminoacyl-tRNA hydrolase [Inhella sp.]
MQALVRALAWRVRARIGDAAVDAFWVRCALRYRSFLRGPVCIAVAGSGGKTTAKELLRAILSAHRRGVATQASLNVVPEVAKMVMRLRPWHQYGLLEVSEDHPGVMQTNVDLLRPEIALVTVFRDDHAAAFQHPEAVADELRLLVRSVGPQGVSVLNADDPTVWAMASLCPGRVLSYGQSGAADLRAEEVQAAWPDRLSFTLLYQGQRVRAQTQLCGAHWVPSVLGAVGVGLAFGLSLKQCADALAAVQPFEGRMQPVSTPGGVHFMRDDFKAPVWTVQSCADLLRAARAPRKFAVLGETSDRRSGYSKERELRQAAQLLAEVCDEVLVVGPWSTTALAAKSPEARQRIKAFDSLWMAHGHLRQQLRAGDLVLLKGTARIDHLQRLVLAQTREIRCWQDDCRRGEFCTTCPQRLEDRPAAGPSRAQRQEWEAGLHSTAWPPPDAFTLLVVGLGNPEQRYRDSPHNAGAQALDALVAESGQDWLESPLGPWCRLMIEGRALLLVKPAVAINLSGEIVLLLARHWGLAPQRIVLVHDDISLPMGDVIIKMHGAAGGHRGVANVLVHLQSDEVLRIKLGVHPAQQPAPMNYVTTPLTQNDLQVLRAALPKLRWRLLRLASGPPPG